MQAFKAALRIYFKHPMYLFIYVIALSVMAVFIGKSVAPAPTKTFEPERPTLAVIDRDGSVFSKGFTDFLSTQGTMVHIKDTKTALQDATAQNYASYIAIIPSGFGADFLSAAAKGTPSPQVQTVISYSSASGSLMNQRANAYLNTAHVYGTSGTVTDQQELVRLTAADMGKNAQVTLVQSKTAAPPSQQYLIFMLFSAYSIMLAIIVCAGLIMVSFNRTELRKRDLSSPVSSLSRNLQIAAACLVVMLISWAWVSVLGLVVFGSALSGVAPGIIVMFLVSLLVYCTVPLAIGFFLGQITGNELVLNAVGNILGLVFSFLGGIWVDVSMMSSGLKLVARFTPTFYYSQALTKLSELKVVSPSTLAPVFANLGMVLLFAAAIFAVALVVGRLRMQSSAAGGNAAAARSVA